MRLFVAIGSESLSFDPREVLRKLQVNLEKNEINYKWVPQANLHITINFLGDVEDERIPSLNEILSRVSQSHWGFDLKIDGVGAFPNNRAGRVIWMGVQNSIPLRQLQSDCKNALHEASFPTDEKDYRPHLTVARLRSPRQLTDILSPVENLELGTLSVKQLTVYQSKLSGHFPIYTPLATFPLSPNPGNLC
jgi:2'-5' RNA ligase